ncbi:hypothetical protein BC829DRAFT_51821 [Chytridium lagenaria]|nr:hypothetical protein BC829DRAFT_51821 [Chytridium lagenaria]
MINRRITLPQVLLTKADWHLAVGANFGGFGVNPLLSQVSLSVVSQHPRYRLQRRNSYSERLCPHSRRFSPHRLRHVCRSLPFERITILRVFNKDIKSRRPFKPAILSVRSRLDTTSSRIPRTFLAYTTSTASPFLLVAAESERFVARPDAGAVWGREKP